MIKRRVGGVMVARWAVDPQDIVQFYANPMTTSGRGGRSAYSYSSEFCLLLLNQWCSCDADKFRYQLLAACF